MKCVVIARYGCDDRPPEKYAKTKYRSRTVGTELACSSRGNIDMRIHVHKGLAPTPFGRILKNTFSLPTYVRTLTDPYVPQCRYWDKHSEVGMEIDPEEEDTV